MTVSTKNIVLATGGRPKYPTHVSVHVCVDEHVHVLFFSCVTLRMRESGFPFRHDTIYTILIQKPFVLEIHFC